MAENREYKSDVFSMLMENKENALQVYNALNGSAYDDPEQVEVISLHIIRTCRYVRLYIILHM